MKLTPHNCELSGQPSQPESLQHFSLLVVCSPRLEEDGNPFMLLYNTTTKKLFILNEMITAHIKSIEPPSNVCLKFANQAKYKVPHWNEKHEKYVN